MIISAFFTRKNKHKTRAIMRKNILSKKCVFFGVDLLTITKLNV